MDLNRLLIFFIGANTLLFALTVRHRDAVARSGTLPSVLAVAATLLASLRLEPEAAGWLGAAVWGPLVLVPLGLHGLLLRWWAQGRHRRAFHLSLVLAVLHPTRERRAAARLLGALARLDAGARVAARRQLERLARGVDAPAVEARMHLLAADARWSELLAVIEGDRRRGELLARPATRRLHREALARSGRLGEVLAAVASTPRAIGGSAACVWAERLQAVAFAGRTALAAEIVFGPLASAPVGWRDRWLEEADRALRRPPPEAALPVAEMAAANVSRALERWRHARRAGRLPAWGTAGLVAANLLAFAVELPGGTTDADNLLALGALLTPPSLLGGEWWRVLTAGFLHFGAAHLLINLGALWIFGQNLEQRIGTPRFVTVYLLSGPAAMTLLVFLSALGPDEPRIVVGASGAVMGVVGATLSVLALDWRRNPHSGAARDVPLLLGVVILQAAFDLSTPQVSFTAHAAGLACGLVLGLLLAPDHGTLVEPAARPLPWRRPGFRSARSTPPSREPG